MISVPSTPLATSTPMWTKRAPLFDDLSLEEELSLTDTPVKISKAKIDWTPRTTKTPRAATAPRFPFAQRPTPTTDPRTPRYAKPTKAWLSHIQMPKTENGEKQSKVMTREQGKDLWQKLVSRNRIEKAVKA